MAMRSLKQADKSKAKSTPEVLQQQKGLADQQKHLKTSLADASLKKTASMPWKRSAPQPEGKELGKGPNGPGPQLAQTRIQQSVRDRIPQTPQLTQSPSGLSPQTPQNEPQQTGPEMGKPKQKSRAMELFELLLGTTKFGQKVLQKRDLFRRINEILSRKGSGPDKPYDQTAFNQKTGQMPQLDQKQSGFKQQIAQRQADLSNKKDIAPKQAISQPPATPKDVASLKQPGQTAAKPTVVGKQEKTQGVKMTKKPLGKNPISLGDLE